MAARIRSIHPRLFTDEAFVSCLPLARLLLLGIWTEADDHGVFEWKPRTLKMRLLAGDQAEVADLLGRSQRSLLDSVPAGVAISKSTTRNEPG
ncbi:hypothetical protein BST63_01165 [Bradyrhizobium canariense]|uniref:Uncharacterized protein n=1 Tax=Bradyrhizobium canariense TaxID=255045 RepID=A0ABX3XBD1_9BRAD|nr:hypothetical protein [Bradyrhizobium canariense]OSJ19761.1 hypothetical protein BSR47_01310 [Bradyrhizobium canariense]OSJ35917.1 hypothetical protein BST63_01165 [Bradyrhizobium canariense]